MKKNQNFFASVSQLTVILAICLVGFFTSCQEETIGPETPTTVMVNSSKNAISPYVFNWEDPNLNFFPYPTNQPQIPPPWTGAGGLASSVSSDVLDDRKASDGWEMIYNTFHPTIWNANPYFMLYNKYRGLLRIYLYVNSVNNIIESSYLQSGLTTAVNTSLLNFSETEIVDVTKNKVRVDRVEPKPYTGSPTSNFRWYFFQYEMAYDQLLLPVPPSSTNGPQFSFYLNTINVTEIGLGGTLKANVNGTIGASQTTGGQNIWNAANGQLKSLGGGALTAMGKNFINSKTTDTNGGNEFGIIPVTWKAVKEGLGAALNITTGSIPGSIYNVLSAVLKGSTSNAGQTVSLTVAGSIQLNGSLTGQGSFPSIPVDWYIPGTLTPPFGVQHYVPLYNKKLGVFNLASKPTIKIRTEKQMSSYNPYTGLYMYQTYYTLQSNTLNIQWNPEVTAIADITNLTCDIIAIVPSQIEYGLTYMTGSRETIMGENAFTSPTFKTIHHLAERPYYLYNSIFLRIAFVVKPKNGSPESVIVKTFDVNKIDEFVML